MRTGDCLSAIGHTELAVDMLEVGLDGARTDHQGLSEFAIGSTTSQQAEHLHLALTQHVHKLSLRRGVSKLEVGPGYVEKSIAKQFVILPRGKETLAS